MAGLKLTPIILKEVNRYLTSPKKVRKFGFDQPPVKTGKDIKRPEDPFREFEERNPMDSGGLAKQRIAAEKYGMSLKKYQSLSQQEKTRLKDKTKREAAKAKGISVDGVKVSKNIRKLPNNTFRFETEAGGGFNKIFPKGTTLKQAENFRDQKLKQFGIEKGKNRPVNPDRGAYESVKGQKHIKFNGVTYQVAVQRMKDKKMVTEKPFYTTSLTEAKKVRDQRVAKAPPKIEKGVVNPDREKIQKRIDERRFIQKTKEGRTGVAFKPPKGYQVHHLLPLALAGPDTNTRDLAVISAQMNQEMSQFDKPIKKLTEEAALLDYQGDRKNSLKRLDKINKELNDIVKRGVKKLGPKYKGLIGFNEITPMFDENGQVFNLQFKPTGVDFKKSIAKNIKVPEKVKKLSTSELQKLVAEAPVAAANPFFSPGVLGEAFKTIPTPLGAVGLTAGFGVDPTSAIDRAGIAAEAAFAPQLVKQSAKMGAAQRLFNLGLTPKMAMRAARIASPLGIASLGAEGLYQAGKFTKKRIGELKAMSPEQRRALRAKQSAFAFEGAREGGIIGKKSGPPPVSGKTPHGLPYETKGVKKL